MRERCLPQIVVVLFSIQVIRDRSQIVCIFWCIMGK